MILASQLNILASSVPASLHHSGFAAQTAGFGPTIFSLTSFAQSALRIHPPNPDLLRVLQSGQQSFYPSTVSPFYASPSPLPTPPSIYCICTMPSAFSRFQMDTFAQFDAIRIAPQSKHCKKFRLRRIGEWEQTQVLLKRPKQTH
jgi:hypothetical protein